MSKETKEKRRIDDVQTAEEVSMAVYGEGPRANSTQADSALDA
jgi:hypothetical protein